MMPTNATDVAKYLEFSLLQLGAESYLHGVNFANSGQVVNAWKFGFNDASHDFIRERAGDAGADAATLPAYNRMVGDQARALFDKFEIVDHHANDSTGFSATLYRAKVADSAAGIVAGSYVLSFRSTEARPWSVAGDFERDNEGANVRGIYQNGFAFAQLASMEDYWSHIRAGEAWDTNSGGWAASAKLANFRDYMNTAGAARQFFATGYSLGGHLANVFTQIHATEVTQTFTFNGAGNGVIKNVETTGAAISQLLSQFALILRDPAAISDAVFAQMLGLPTGSTIPVEWRNRRAAAIAARNAATQSDPFATENGRIDQAPSAPNLLRGNIYRDARYTFAEALIQASTPTKSLAGVAAQLAVGVAVSALPSGASALLAQLIGALATGNFAVFRDLVASGGGSEAVVWGGYEKILSLSGQASTDDIQGVGDVQRHSANTLGVIIEDQPDVYGNGGLLPGINNPYSIAEQIRKAKAGEGPGDFGTSHALILLIDTLSLVQAIQRNLMVPESQIVRALLPATSATRAIRCA